MKTEAAELLVSNLAAKTSWAAGFAGFFAFLTSSQGMGLVSVLVAVLAFLVNTYYKHKADVRAEALLKIRNEYLQTRRNPITDFAGLGDKEE